MGSYRHSTSFRAAARCITLFLGLAVAAGHVAWGQSQLSEPVYHVPREAAAQARVVPAAFPAPATGAPFDLTQKPNEHPLAPVIRVCKGVLANIDKNVSDYSCLFEKQERIDGELGAKQRINLKVRHKPFSVYMYFNDPYPRREVIFVDGQNQNEMLVMDSGWKRRLVGQIQLDPNGMLAMRGQKHPITRVGMRNLLAEIIDGAEADMKFAECEVTSNPNTMIDNRSMTLIQITHPQPRREFRAHIARLFLDNELRVPFYYDVYLWPTEPDQKPPLDSSYTYRNMKINSGLTTSDFDPENPKIFLP